MKYVFEQDQKDYELPFLSRDEEDEKKETPPERKKSLIGPLAVEAGNQVFGTLGLNAHLISFLTERDFKALKTTSKAFNGGQATLPPKYRRWGAKAYNYSFFALTCADCCSKKKMEEVVKPVPLCGDVVRCYDWMELRSTHCPGMLVIGWIMLVMSPCIAPCFLCATISCLLGMMAGGVATLADDCSPPPALPPKRIINLPPPRQQM